MRRPINFIFVNLGNPIYASFLNSYRSSDSPCNSNDADNEDTIVDDSDLDVEPELPHLTKVISEDLLRKMKPKEKKRQEVINGNNWYFFPSVHQYSLLFYIWSSVLA